MSEVRVYWRRQQEASRTHSPKKWRSNIRMPVDSSNLSLGEELREKLIAQEKAAAERKAEREKLQAQESCASPSKSSDVQSDASTTATPPKECSSPSSGEEPKPHMLSKEWLFERLQEERLLSGLYLQVLEADKADESLVKQLLEQRLKVVQLEQEKLQVEKQKAKAEELAQQRLQVMQLEQENAARAEKQRAKALAEKRLAQAQARSARNAGCFGWLSDWTSKSIRFFLA
mmetsp:Transcript_22472/g.52934  ORF Transcript_22472/g.52934 Transcript_22472/m.52934 type:complete len:231 (+) Transcript_22472:72-764(+)